MTERLVEAAVGISAAVFLALALFALGVCLAVGAHIVRNWWRSR